MINIAENGSIEIGRFHLMMMMMMMIVDVDENNTKKGRERKIRR